MRIISRKTLIQFWESNPQYRDARAPLAAWYQEAKQATWSTPTDIKTQYHNASICKSGQVVFKIARNKYELIVTIHYDRQIVYIQFVGIHQQCDQIDAERL